MEDDKIGHFHYRVAKTIFAHCRQNGDWQTLWSYAEPLMTIFPDSIEIKDEASIAAFYLQKYKQCVAILNQLLSTPGLDTAFIHRITQNKSYCIEWLKKEAKKIWTYPPQVLPATRLSPFILVCHDTTWNHVASFLTNCQDAYKFSQWFITATLEEPVPTWAVDRFRPLTKPWPQVCDELTPYIFLMTGSWLFFDQRPYLSLMQSVIDTKDPSFAQVFVNRQPGHHDHHHVPRLGTRYCMLEQKLDMTQPSLLYREILFEHKFEEKEYPVAMLDAEHCIYQK